MAFAAPAAVVVPLDTGTGLALAVGVLPAAMVPLPATRPARSMLLVVGPVVGLGLFLGSLLAQIPAVAVVGLAALSVAAALAASRWRLGGFALTLGLPMVGAGLSFTDVPQAAETCGLMVAGALYAWLVSLAWPERPAPPDPAAPPVPERAGMLVYGVRLGLAASIAAAIGFASGTDYVGWAPAAALLVARPSVAATQLRAVGRLGSVILGALAAASFILLDPPVAALAVAAVLAVALAAATAGSRWYVTAAFTTFLVFLLLLYDHPQDAQWRFGERVGETLVGVGLAALFLIVVPWIAGRVRGSAGVRGQQR